MTRTAIKFGVFVAVCTAFTLWLAFTIGNIELSDLNPVGAEDYTLEARFDDVSGLLINDEVKIAGVEVGKVTGIGVEQGRAVVTFVVDSSYAGRLGADTSASVRWRNLIGQRFLYLVPGSDTTTVLESGAEVCPQPREEELDCRNDSVADLGALFNNLGPIVEAIDEGQVNQFMETVTGALEGNVDNLGQALEDLATVSSGLATRDEAISRLIGNLDTIAGTIAARDQQIRTILDNLVLLSETFSDNTDVVDQALVEFGAFSTDLSTLVERNRDEIDRIIANLDLTVNDELVPRLEALDRALAGFDEAARAIFNAGRNGEWLNQTILCAANEPPPPNAPCETPIVTGASSGGPAEAASFEQRVSALTTLVLGPVAEGAG